MKNFKDKFHESVVVGLVRLRRGSSLARSNSIALPCDRMRRLHDSGRVRCQTEEVSGGTWASQMDVTVSVT